MQEKLAEMKSKHLTKVAIRVKPVPESNDIQADSPPDPNESFNVLSSSEMGLAKQIVFNDSSY